MQRPLLQTTALLALSLHAVCGALALAVPVLHATDRAVLLSRHEQLRDEYDYVVVGGGTSGLVVANRLTEDPKSALNATFLCA